MKVILRAIGGYLHDVVAAMFDAIYECWTDFVEVVCDGRK